MLECIYYICGDKYRHQIADGIGYTGRCDLLCNWIEHDITEYGGDERTEVSLSVEDTYSGVRCCGTAVGPMPYVMADVRCVVGEVMKQVEIGVTAMHVPQTWECKKCHTVLVGNSSSSGVCWPCEHGLPNKWVQFIAEPMSRLINAKTPLPGLTLIDYAKAKKCDCGAEKCRTTHAHWCSTRNGK